MPSAVAVADADADADVFGYTDGFGDAGVYPCRVRGHEFRISSACEQHAVSSPFHTLMSIATSHDFVFPLCPQNWMVCPCRTPS